MAKKLLTLGKDGTLVMRSADGSSEPVPMPAHAAVQTEPHVAYLLIDCSSSMDGSLEDAKSGSLRFFADALEQGYYVGLIKFASDAVLLCEPTRDRAIIQGHLRGMATGGSTNMSEAIEIAIHCLSIGKFPRAAVLVTDGMPDNKESALAAARRARADGIDIIAIGTGDADREFLAELASRDDLAVKVARQQLAESISSMSRLLPGSQPARSK